MTPRVRPRVLVVQHQDTCPPALLGQWLVESGMDLDVRRPDRGEPLPPDLTGYDALLVLGGSMDAVDDAGHPWLAETVTLLRLAVAGALPTLGVCLGHQLLARACGGVVDRNPRGRQLGVISMGWTDDATGDPLIGALAAAAPEARCLQWNQDIVVELPEAAVVLARTSAQEPQLVRFAARAWGIQAHPEADQSVARWWADDAAPDVSSAAAEQTVADMGTCAAELVTTWRPLADALAAVVVDAVASDVGAVS